MQTKQGWMNLKFRLDTRIGQTKPVSLDILRKYNSRDIHSSLIVNDISFNAFLLCELYVWEKGLLKEWEELGLWEKYKPIQFDSVEEFFSYDKNNNSVSYDYHKLYDIMKYFVNGSYKSEDILDSVWCPIGGKYKYTENDQRGSCVFSQFPYSQPNLTYGVSSVMNQIASHYYNDLFVKKMYEGGKPPLPYFNEKLSIQKKMGSLPKIVQKSWKKLVIHESNKIFSKKLKKKFCSDAIEEVNKNQNTNFKCENPNKKKFFKNCCSLKIVKQMIPLQLQRIQNSKQRQIMDNFSKNMVGHTRTKEPLKPYTQRKPKYDKIIEELFDIEQRPTSYTKKNLIDKKGMWIEQFHLFNDCLYKKIEHLYKYRNEYQEMISPFNYGALINNYQMELTFQSNRIEVGLKDPTLGFDGKWTIEKLFRYCEEVSEIKEGLQYQFGIEPHSAGERFMIFHSLIRPDEDVDDDTEMKIYRCVQRVRHWVGHSWSDNDLQAEFFLSQHYLKDEGGQSAVERNSRVGKSFEAFGYLCELKVKRGEILTRRKRGLLVEDECIMIKKHLNKDNLRIWRVKSSGVYKSNTQSGYKKLYEVKKGNIPNNPLWNTDEYPRYY